MLTKKGEKVDYAIKKDDKVIILVECKWSGLDLHEENASQLYRYFSATEARFAVLTNGIFYKFYSDIDEKNKMDSKPFFEFNILEFEDHHIDELKRFTKQAFSLEDILTTASTLKYAGSIKKILEKELKNPSESFVRFFASQVYDGRLTHAVLEQFTNIVKEARSQFINEKIKKRLNSALSASDSESASSSESMIEIGNDASEETDRIITTQEEVDGFNIVRAILCESIDISRVVMKDAKSYCRVLLDGNSRKTICRFHFNHSHKYISLFSDKKENRIKIDSLEDIFKYSEQIKLSVSVYEQE